MSIVTRNKRVVFVTQRFPPDKGGNAARVHDMTTNLTDEWDVMVLSPPPSYPPGEFDRTQTRKRTDSVGGVTVHRLWTWQPQTEDPSMSERMAYYLLFGLHTMLWLLWNCRSYDVVVTTTPPISTGAPGLLTKALGKPLVVDVRDLWIDASISLGYLEAGSLLERVSRRFQRRVLRTADRIAVTTDLLGETLVETYGESLEPKLILIPNGVDVQEFQFPDERHTRDRSTSTKPVEGTAKVDETEPILGVDPKPDGGEATIIYTGNIGAAQDLESCIRAMAFLSHDATLRLVGSGDMESRLRQLRDELNLRERVKFEGIVPRERIPSLLNEATIGIAPLKDTDELAYAMPTKVYEYAASGLPVVVTGRGEIEGFVTRSGCGVHASNDPKRIAEAFDKLIADDNRRREMALNGREYVETKYDRKAIAERFSTELSRVTKGERSG